MVARTGIFVAPLPGTTPAGTSPTDGRLVLGSLFGTGGGCLSGGAFTASATVMQVTVAAAVWRIPDPTNAAGVYLSPADPATLTFSAGPASGSRIDVIWVRQNNYEAGDADSRVTYGVVTGTAATTPVAPATPAGAMKIGQLTVPTGASNAAACALVVSYPATVAPPSISASSSAVLATITGQYVGQLAYIGTDTYRWNGTIWRPWSQDGTAALTFAGTVANLAAGRVTTLAREGRTVTLDLMVTAGSAGFFDTSPIVTLPDGFRPATEYQFVTGVYGGGGAGAYTGFAVLQINADGTVRFKYATGGNGANTQYSGTASFPAAP